MHIVNGRKFTLWCLMLTLPILWFTGIHEVLAADIEKGVKAATEPIIALIDSNSGKLLILFLLLTAYLSEPNRLDKNGGDAKEKNLR